MHSFILKKELHETDSRRKKYMYLEGEKLET